MEHVRGTFWHGGTRVARNAEIQLILDLSDPVADWYGSFELPIDAEMAAPGEYSLTLEDGRHGKVMVTRLQVVLQSTVGTFGGIGPLRDAAGVAHG
jgi:hypothetical protein